MLTKRINALVAMQQKREVFALDARSDPANFGYIWLPWLNDTMVGDATDISYDLKNVV